MGECANNHQLLPIPDHQGPPLNHQPVHLAIPEARGKLRTNCSKNQYSVRTSYKDEGESLGEMERVWNEVAKSEMRISLMDSLKEIKVGFNDIEYFNLGLQYNFKSDLHTEIDRDKGRDTTVIEAAMKLKRKDEIKYRRIMMRKKMKMRKEQEEILGKKSNKHRKMMSRLAEMVEETKKNLREKYDRKIKHLRDKFDQDKEMQLDKVPDEMMDFSGIAVFDRKKFDGIEMEEQKIVKYGDVETSEEEDMILKMHPKMSVVARLHEGYMALNQDIGYTKVRWEMMKDEEEETGQETRPRKRRKTEEDKVEKEKEEQRELEEARTRQVYDPEKKQYDERRQRVTDMAECTRIHLPKPLKVAREAELEMRREAHGKISEKYRRENCDEKGNPQSNLTRQELRGLKSLEERKEKGEIVVTMTDKSTKFCIMRQEDYLKLGEDHTKKDIEITREEVQKREKILNSHALYWCRM